MLKKRIPTIKTKICATLALCLYGGILCSQTYVTRVAVVDMKQITASLPQYVKAQQYISQRESFWQDKIDSVEVVCDSLNEVFQIRKMILPEEVQSDISTKITALRAQTDSLRVAYFGPEGLYVKEKRRLIEPIIQSIHSHINDYAQKNKISVVLDKSEMTVLYFDKFSDISEVILRKMEKENKKE